MWVRDRAGAPAGLALSAPHSGRQEVARGGSSFTDDATGLMPWAPSGFLQFQAWVGPGLLCLEPGARSPEPRRRRLPRACDRWQSSLASAASRQHFPSASQELRAGRSLRSQRGVYHPGSPTQIFGSWPFCLGAPVCPGAARTGAPSSSPTGGPGPHPGRILLPGGRGRGGLSSKHKRERSFWEPG